MLIIKPVILTALVMSIFMAWDAYNGINTFLLIVFFLLMTSV